MLDELERIDTGEEEFLKNIEKQKSIFTKNTLIWLFSFLIAFFVIVIGYIDFQADYAVISTSSSFVTTYTSQGEIITHTYYPIFGRATYHKPQGGFLPDAINFSIHEWIIMGIIIFITIPSSLIYQIEAKRLKGIDNNMPYLLREIADSQKIGMTLPRAIQEASKRNYGPLTKELKKLAAKISWGIPFRDAMRAFRDALDTPLARQATILILEAERSGGDLEKIFDSAQTYVQDLLDIKRERENSIKPYVYIIYMSYIIFAVVIYVLFTTFFAPFGLNPIAGQQVPIPLDAFKTAFLYVLIIQAFFSGLTAGKMGTGRISVGLWHSSILMIIGLLVDKLLILRKVASMEQQA